MGVFYEAKFGSPFLFLDPEKSITMTDLRIFKLSSVETSQRFDKSKPKSRFLLLVLEANLLFRKREQISFYQGRCQILRISADVKTRLRGRTFQGLHKSKPESQFLFVVLEINNGAIYKENITNEKILKVSTYLNSRASVFIFTNQ